MSDPVIESQEIKETQEFPSIQNVEGAKKMKGAKRVKGTMRNGEKQSGLVWSAHENMIYTGINAQNQYIYWHKCSCHNCDGRTTDGRKVKIELF